MRFECKTIKDSYQFQGCNVSLGYKSKCFLCVSNCMSFVKFKFDQRKCLCKTMESTNVNSVKDSELL